MQPQTSRLAGPPRLPRALFIAAFAAAGAQQHRRRLAPLLPPLTPARIERRERSIGNVARGIGSALAAAERSADDFARRGTMVPAPPEPPRPRLDPAVEALLTSPALALAIGRPVVGRDNEAPWIELRRDAASPHLKLYWRGEIVRGERMVRLLKEENGRVWSEDAEGETVGSARTLCLERFAEGVDAAKAALAAAGVRASSFCEIRRLNVPSLDGGPAFKGAVATIGLQRPAPVWATQLGRRAGMAR